MAIITPAQIRKLIRPHSGRIIRGRGTSLKSAPRMPLDKDTEPIARVMKIASTTNTAVVRIVGWKNRKPRMAPIGSMNREKKVMNANLLRIKSFADTGDV